jgi:hypothetical protein
LFVLRALRAIIMVSRCGSNTGPFYARHEISGKGASHATRLGVIVGALSLMATEPVAAGSAADCCADLEERIAELEATTVRRGNRKLNVSISG